MRDTVIRSRWPCSSRVNFARLVFSQSCAVFFSRRVAQVEDHLVDVVLERRHLAGRLDGDRPRQVALGDGGRDFRDGAHLRGEVGGEPVDVVGQVAPGAGGAGHARLAAQLAFDADLARHGGDLIGEGRQRVDHPVDRFGQLLDLALRFEHQLAPQVAVGDVGDDPGDAAHLVGQVVGHEVDVVGQVLPGAGDPLHLRLAAELALPCRPRGRRASLPRRTCRAGRPSC